MERNTQTGKYRVKFSHYFILKTPGKRMGVVRAAGFTLLEMMIVITIILILASDCRGHYEKSVLRAKEATLKQDLFVMRQAIQQYTLDKQTAPSSLDDLVQSKYMSSIPKDPLDEQSVGIGTWISKMFYLVRNKRRRA